ILKHRTGRHCIDPLHRVRLFGRDPADLPAAGATLIQKAYLAVRRFDDGGYAEKKIDSFCALVCGQPPEQGQDAFCPRLQCEVGWSARLIEDATVHVRPCPFRRSRHGSASPRGLSARWTPCHSRANYPASTWKPVFFES